MPAERVDRLNVIRHRHTLSVDVHTHRCLAKHIQLRETERDHHVHRLATLHHLLELLHQYFRLLLENGGKIIQYGEMEGGRDGASPRLPGGPVAGEQPTAEPLVHEIIEETFLEQRLAAHQRLGVVGTARDDERERSEPDDEEVVVLERPLLCILEELMK